MTPAEAEWRAGVHSAIRHQDCERAVSRLNDGLRARYPDAYLMAGAMYEHGVCLKPQWARAAAMYQSAHAAGRPAGLYRLVAGLVDKDQALALWWAQEGAIQGLPSDCRVAESVHRDAEAFAAAVGRWSETQRSVCAYVTGVVAAVLGEIGDPGEFVGRAVAGKVRMQFLPGVGGIEWHDHEIKLSYVLGLDPSEATRAKDVQAVRDVVQDFFDATARRALARFAKPQGIDPSAAVSIGMSFVFH